MLRRDVDRPRCLCYPHCIKPSPQTEKKCWDWVKKGLWEFLRSLVTARKPAIWLHAMFVFLWSHGLEIFQLALGAFLAWSIIRGYRALKCYLRVENTRTRRDTRTLKHPNEKNGINSVFFSTIFQQFQANTCRNSELEEKFG